MSKLSKKNTPELDLKAADNMLSNIFESAEVKPNTVPLEVLVSYSNYRKERFILQKIVIGVVFVIFLLLPLLFIAPKFDITLLETETSTKYDPTYEIEVESGIIPVKRISASIAGQNLSVYEVDDNVYEIEPDVNGTMEVTVVLANHQELTKEITIDSIDVTPPILISNEKNGDILTITIEDEGSGIDYEGIYAEDLSGVTCQPVSYDEENGTVSFNFPEYPMNIFVPDYGGNELQLALTLG